MLTIEVNDRLVLDALRDLKHRVQDMRPVMAGIGQEMVSRVSARFETQSDPLGHPWAAWKPSTVSTYPKDGHGRILDRTGDQLDSLSFQVNRNTVQIGFAQPYATFHEFGTQHMPRRGLLFADPEAGTLSPDDTDSILEIVRGYLASA